MNSHIRRMTECSMMVALASVLSLLPLVEMPYGGSITLASMLPIVILSYRHGAAWGLVSGLLYGVIQQLLGLKNLSYFTTWQSVLAVILLDYLIAYAVIGLAGIFRRREKNQPLALLYGGVFACLLRYLLHVIAGATVWAGLSIPTEAALLYSISYNATYMLPETLILVTVLFYIGTVLDFSADIPRHMRSTALCRAAVIARTVGSFILVFGVLISTVLIFPLLQNAETGEFDMAGLSEASSLLGLWVLLGAILIGAAAFVYAHVADRRYKVKNGN